MNQKSQDTTIDNNKHNYGPFLAATIALLVITLVHEAGDIKAVSDFYRILVYPFLFTFIPLLISAILYQQKRSNWLVLCITSIFWLFGFILFMIEALAPSPFNFPSPFLSISPVLDWTHALPAALLASGTLIGYGKKWFTRYILVMVIFLVLYGMYTYTW
jgi:uncharacterized membrane protein